MIYELPEHSILETFYEKLSDDPIKRLDGLEYLAKQVYQININAWEKENEDAVSSDDSEI